MRHWPRAPSLTTGQPTAPGPGARIRMVVAGLRPRAGADLPACRHQPARWQARHGLQPPVAAPARDGLRQLCYLPGLAGVPVRWRGVAGVRERADHQSHRVLSRAAPFRDLCPASAQQAGRHGLEGLVQRGLDRGRALLHRHDGPGSAGRHAQLPVAGQRHRLACAGHGVGRCLSRRKHQGHERRAPAPLLPAGQGRQCGPGARQARAAPPGGVSQRQSDP